MQTCRYIDRGVERLVQFPLDGKDDISGSISSASSVALNDYQDKLKAIQLRQKGLSKGEIAEKLGRSEHWVKRWWRQHPATLERPFAARDVALKKAAISSFRDLDIRRNFLDGTSIFDTLVEKVPWQQAKVVGRDLNTGELSLRFNAQGQTMNAGRQVADYNGGLSCVDKVLQKVFTEMDIRDQHPRIFMNYYLNGQERLGTHRHDFWTALVNIGASRILTVDGRAFLLHDGDLIVFGTQTHGVPVMPDMIGGRISLVIFFYPDAGNLERQWLTIAAEDGDEDGDEERDESKLAAVPSKDVCAGIDSRFDPSLLWGNVRTDDPTELEACECSFTHDNGTFKQTSKPKPSGLREYHELKEDPNQTVGSMKVYSIVCPDDWNDPVVAERQFFEQAKLHEVTELWDLRLHQTRGVWCDQEILRKSCATRLVKYRSYPIGRREVGGVLHHIHTDEGHYILKKFIVAAAQATVAFVAPQTECDRPESLRSTVSDLLVSGQLGHEIHVWHIVFDKLREHPRNPVLAEGMQTVQPAQLGRTPSNSGLIKKAELNCVAANDLSLTVGKKVAGSRWGRSARAAVTNSSASLSSMSGVTETATEAAIPSRGCALDGTVKPTARWKKRHGGE